MKVIYEKDQQKFPIKVWLESSTDIEESCLKQSLQLANLPFIHKWVALMPDTHAGKGMPIGGVIATDGVIIPNAVGVDIGCGMAYMQTDIKASFLRDTETGNGSLLQAIIGDMLRNIPTGFGKYKERQPSKVLDQVMSNPTDYEKDNLLFNEIEAGYYQVGTLGGGNHFIEIQEDEDGFVGIMLHSGSRHFGLTICNYFNEIAVKLNKEWHVSVPSEYHLAYLPTQSPEGQAYIRWMELALDYAHENRERMLTMTQEILTKWCQKVSHDAPVFSDKINCHHNYANLENHYGKNVWVHRKGAIRAREGELGIIPGAMGSYSYLVKGLENPESFHSCSHGAGRLLGRKKAMEAFSVEEVMVDLKIQGVVLGKNGKNDVPEESRFAYKDIDQVIANETDLVTPIKKLKTMGVVKG